MRKVEVISPRLWRRFAEGFEQGASETHILESLRGIEPLKSGCATTHARRRFSDLKARDANTAQRLARLSASAGNVTGLIQTAATAGVLFAAAFLMPDGAPSIGAPVTFAMFSAALFEPLKALIDTWDALREPVKSIERLNDVLDRTPEHGPVDAQPEPLSLPRPRGAPPFEQVVFRQHLDERPNAMPNFTPGI